ncbi:MAG: histidine triad nucleotide-binding protein [Undibacterium sp.]|nr:histidine triad nucleotide-binding protein [Undibacterium sp.]
MDNCIFCKIVARQLPSTIVYEDDEMLAFKDINPAAPVHFLLIPKMHLDGLAKAEAKHTEILGKLLGLAPQLARQHGCDVIEHTDGSRSGGFKTVINTGPDGGQLVYHLHLHVLGTPNK